MFYLIRENSEASIREFEYSQNELGTTEYLLILRKFLFQLIEWNKKNEFFKKILEGACIFSSFFGSEFCRLQFFDFS